MIQLMAAEKQYNCKKTVLLTLRRAFCTSHEHKIGNKKIGWTKFCLNHRNLHDSSNSLSIRSHKSNHLRSYNIRKWNSSVLSKRELFLVNLTLLVLREDNNCQPDPTSTLSLAALSVRYNERVAFVEYTPFINSSVFCYMLIRPTGLTLVYMFF